VFSALQTFTAVVGAREILLQGRIDERKSVS